MQRNTVVQDATVVGIKFAKRNANTTAQRISGQVYKVQNLQAGIVAELERARAYTRAAVYSACDVSTKRVYIACRLSDKPLLNSVKQSGQATMLVSGQFAEQFCKLSGYVIKQRSAAGKLTAKQLAKQVAEASCEIAPDARHAVNGINLVQFDGVYPQEQRASLLLESKAEQVPCYVVEQLNGQTVKHVFNSSHDVRKLGFSSALLSGGQLSNLLFDTAPNSALLDSQRLLLELVAQSIAEQFNTERASFAEQRKASAKRVAHCFAKQRATLEFAEQRKAAELAAAQASNAERSAAAQLERAKALLSSFAATSQRIGKLDSELGKLAAAQRSATKGYDVSAEEKTATEQGKRFANKAEQRKALQDITAQRRAAQLERAKLAKLQSNRKRNARHIHCLQRVKRASSALVAAQAGKAAAAQAVQSIAAQELAACAEQRKAAAAERSRKNWIAQVVIAERKAAHASAELASIAEQHKEFLAMGQDFKALRSAMEFYAEQLAFYRRAMRAAKQGLRNMGAEQLALHDANAKAAKAEQDAKRAKQYQERKAQSLLYQVYESTRLELKNAERRAAQDAQELAKVQAEKLRLKAAYDSAKKQSGAEQFSREESASLLGIHAGKSM